MQARHPRESEAVMSELMMPQHANIMGNVFGGVILSLVDRVAAVAAIRHARKPCVTVSVDKVDFKEPIHVGELLTAHARVNYAGRPTPVPSIVPETPDEKRRYDRAAKRRASRVMDRRYDTGAGE